MAIICTTYEQVENYVLDRMKQGNFLGITSQFEELDSDQLLYLASWANEELDKYQAPIATDAFGDTFDLRQMTSANDLILDICKQKGIKLPQPPAGVYKLENGKYDTRINIEAIPKISNSFKIKHKKPIIIKVIPNL